MSFYAGQKLQKKKESDSPLTALLRSPRRDVMGNRTLIALVIAGCVPLAGCGGGRDAALQRYNDEVKVLEGIKKEYDDQFEPIRQAHLGAVKRIELAGGTPSKERTDELEAAEKRLHDLMSERIDAQQQRVDESKAALDAFDDH
jgi:hypothetical protein